MNKVLLVLVVLLIVLAAVEGYFINRERNEKMALGLAMAKAQQSMMPKPTGTKPMPLMKGDVFTKNPLSQKAYLVAPTNGSLSAGAQQALTNWIVSSTKNSDGTTTVTLTPKEAEDVQQSFVLKTGYKLYFVDLSPNDDKPGIDELRGDDMGILVDDKGLVQ